jgi:membrane protease YdiL (CAAX protease family)
MRWTSNVSSNVSSKVSWLVVLICVGAIVIQGQLSRRDSAGATSAPSEDVDFPTVLVGKYTVGIGERAPASADQAIASLEQQAKSPIQKLAVATVAAEVKDAQSAIDRLEAIPSDDAAALRAWYQQQTPLPADLVDRLDWFGEMAQVYGKPDSDPQRSDVMASASSVLVILLVMFIGLSLAAVAGLGLLVTAIVLLAMGKLRFSVATPRGPTAVYIEAFAIWIALFLGGAIVTNVLLPIDSVAISVAPLVLAFAALLAWPGLRGVSWDVLRDDWGLHAGKNVFVEMFWGIVGYLAGLPILAAMVMLSMVLAKMTGQQVSHPIVDEIRDHALVVALLAAVFAPITEEIVFRGALLSHLRGTWGIVVASLINGLVFAAIHPQGLAGIPVLMAIGTILGLIRQWRGSLVSTMTAHALNNGFIVLLLIGVSKM